MAIRVDGSLGEIDWARLKADLAADDFDNGRTAEALRRSFEQSGHVAIARDGERVVGTARLLTDGVCNAYLLDVWTATAYRRRGIASAMVGLLCDAVPGQHVGLQTDEAQPLYASLGFRPQPEFWSRVSGCWLDNDANGRLGAAAAGTYDRRMFRKDAKIELLKQVPLFSGCSRRELGEIASIADEMHFPAGRTLIEEGQPGREFFVVVDGAVEVRRRGRKVAGQSGSSFYGEASLLTGKPRNATVVTTEPVRALVVTDRAFERLLRESPSIQRKILAALADRLAD